MKKQQRADVVAKWGGMVWRLALARTADIHDAEDVFQEVFLRFFRHEDKIDTDEHRKAWLIRCTINRAKSVLTAPWRKRTLPLNVAETLGMCDEYREIYAAVLALPVKYRTVIHLYYYEGMSAAEIAGLTGCTESTVRAQLSRGRGMLRETLKEEVEI